MTDPQSLARVLYLPHGGGPLPVLGDKAHEPLIKFLRQIPDSLGRPGAILVVSAHWEAERPTLTGAERPPLIYDYHGFPPESYQIEYAAPGAPALAKRIEGLLSDAGLAAGIDPARGFDHGLFIPLKLMYPTAGIPCLQLSLLGSLDPAAHIRLGRALAPLRQEGVLILGSGLSFHNLRAMFAVTSRVDVDESLEFDRWLTETCVDRRLSAEERESRLIEWEKAPYARYCHPREEHLLPLHVCYGAASADTPFAELVFNAKLMGKRVSGLLW